jgi:hypothetical protein
MPAWRLAESLSASRTAYGTARKDVLPHRPIAPGNAPSAAPLGLAIFGGFFCALWIRKSLTETQRPRRVSVCDLASLCLRAFVGALPA